MSDCNTCNWEHLCAYEYKPCDCVHKRKFREKEGIIECQTCRNKPVFPPCTICKGSGHVVKSEVV